MQRVLEKMARQLNDYDEASLMQLWHFFAGRVQNFEPSKRWEEAAVALCLIQAVHWKNQLFNYNLALSRDPEAGDLPPLPEFFTRHGKSSPGRPGRTAGTGREEEPERKATVLAFPDKARQTRGADGTESGKESGDRKDDD